MFFQRVKSEESRMKNEEVMEQFSGRATLFFLGGFFFGTVWVGERVEGYKRVCRVRGRCGLVNGLRQT